MNTHAYKTQENKSQAAANSFSKQQSDSKSTFQFAGNRPETIAQKEWQKMANNSLQTMQLRAFRNIVGNYSFQKQQPIQKKSPKAIIQRVKTEDVTFNNKINQEADPAVKHFVDNLPKHKLDILVKASKDNPAAFQSAIGSLDGFTGERGWYSFISKIPNRAMASYRVKEQAKKGKLMPTGEATHEQLAEIHAFTQHGDMLNVPLRYQPAWMGPELESRLEELRDGMESLRRVPSRSAAGKIVYSGKAYNMVDFQAKIDGNTGSKVPLSGMVSSTSKLETAKGFVKLTEKWAGSGQKVGVIFRIHSTAGVHIDDLSEWGHHMGPDRHWDAPEAVQVQDEVLMDQGDFIQISEPVKYQEINGMQYYFVDCREPDRSQVSASLLPQMPAALAAPPSAPVIPSQVRKSSHGTMAREGIMPKSPRADKGTRHDPNEYNRKLHPQRWK